MHLSTNMKKKYEKWVQLRLNALIRKNVGQLLKKIGNHIYMQLHTNPVSDDKLLKI